MSAQTDLQQRKVIQVLEPYLSKSWHTTREIADQTPWSVRTVIYTLDQLADAGTVEKRPGSDCHWRLL